MELLKSVDDFEKWKSTEFSYNETVSLPKEFPCYAYSVVSSWGYEESSPVYVYLDDLQRMIEEMEKLKPSSVCSCKFRPWGKVIHKKGCPKGE